MPTTLTILLLFAPLVKSFFNLPEDNGTTFRVELTAAVTPPTDEIDGTCFFKEHSPGMNY